MRVFVAGGTGVIGRQLLPKLRDAGHQVVVAGRDRKRFDRMQVSGVTFVRADILDREAATAAVRDAEPDAVVHIATAIPANLNPKKIADEFALTNRLRTEGTANLLFGARQVGVDRVIAQSVAFAYAPGPGLRTESDPLWRDPPRRFAPVLDAVRELEERTLTHGGIVLRFGHLYGPGTAFAADGSIAEQVRKRQLPLVGPGASIFSFLHTADAADSVLAALAHPVSAAFNVVDDDPAPIAEWLPAYAQALGAGKPRRAPALVVRMAAGGWGLAFLSRLPGASNAKAKAELDWTPAHDQWRRGLLGDVEQVRRRPNAVAV